MTDRTFTAAELLELLSGKGTAADKVQALHELILFPPRPTLADMSMLDRAECRWMQCDYGGVIRDSQSRGVIGYLDHGDKVAVILTTKCGIRRRDYASVTPRPDLPRLEWPGDTPETPEPAPTLPDGWLLADHPGHGRVIITNPTPDGDGNVYFVSPTTGTRGHTWHFCDLDELTCLDQEGDTPTGPDHLAVGTVIESADDPRIAALPVGSILLDRVGEAATKRRMAWMGRGYVPISSQGGEFGPWTVLHIPKEADQ